MISIPVNPSTFLIRKLEIRELKQKLAMGIEVDNHRLPACWPTINKVVECSDRPYGARFRVLPDCPLRLDYQTGVQAALLVSRWSEVIVCKHGAKRAVYFVVV